MRSRGQTRRRRARKTTAASARRRLLRGRRKDGRDYQRRQQAVAVQGLHMSTVCLALRVGIHIRQHCFASSITFVSCAPCTDSCRLMRRSTSSVPCNRCLLDSDHNSHAAQPRVPRVCRFGGVAVAGLSKSFASLPSGMSLASWAMAWRKSLSLPVLYSNEDMSACRFVALACAYAHAQVYV